VNHIIDILLLQLDLEYKEKFANTLKNTKDLNFEPLPRVPGPVPKKIPSLRQVSGS
jgi:hypothetical protein